VSNGRLMRLSAAEGAVHVRLSRRMSALVTLPADEFAFESGLPKR